MSFYIRLGKLSIFSTSKEVIIMYIHMTPAFLNNPDHNR